MITYPTAHRTDTVDELFGHTIPDPYRWLEESESAQTIAWQRAQDALYSQFRDAAPGRALVCARLRTIAGYDITGMPVWRGQRQFVIRRPAGHEHGCLWTTDADGTERLLIDPMVTDPTGRTTLDIWQPSSEGDLLAYQTSVGGTEDSELRIMSVATGQLVDGPIDRTRYSILAWLPGGEAFFYVRKAPPVAVPPGEAAYHRRIYLHVIGTPADQDVLVFGAELSEERSYAIGLSRDGRWLVVSATRGTAADNRVWLADLSVSDPTAPEFREVDTGGPGLTQLVIGRDGRGYACTTNQAPLGRLCVFDPDTPDCCHWRDLVPSRPDAVLRNWSVLDGPDLEVPLLLVGWTRRAVSEVTVHDLASGSLLSAMPLPGLGAVSGMSTRPEGGHEAWFTYTDYLTPPTVYHFDALRGNVRPWCSPRAEPVQAAVSRETCVSADGTEVDMLIVAPLSPEHRAPRPTLLRGYGGFGVTTGPQYSPEVLSWVRAGGVYVQAQVRGGGEKGQSWHGDGMAERKQNAFDDFRAVAERLVSGSWTVPEQLAIIGASNGGLMVGAALTQQPNLFAAAVCSAPLLAMVRYEHHGLGRLWRAEYGSASDSQQLGWLLSYSPYHRVRAGTHYPAVLFTVSDNDTRVDPSHARKMCAALQHATVGDGPILLRRDQLGHGARSLTSAMELLADSLIFLALHTSLDVAALY